MAGAVTAFTDARDAIKAMWNANWAGDPAVPVFWHENGENILPDNPAVTPAFVYLAAVFDADRLRAFGGGPQANDRILSGAVEIRVFAGRGVGEDTALTLLDQATAAFRSRRSADGALSFIGDAVFPAPLARMDGLWWQRTSLAAFEFRYQG